MIPITAGGAGSGHARPVAAEGACDENDLRGDGPCFRVHDRHGRDHDYCADRVMRELLIFLGRGFALFAGGPDVVYQNRSFNRSAVVVAVQKRGRGPAEW